jgi:hypothetical protein
VRIRRPRAGAAIRAALLTALTAAVALAPSPAAADGPASPDVEISVAIPGEAGRPLDDAVLRWGLNDEAGAGAFYGGCHFLSAGTAGDAGSSRLWTAGDGLYRAVDGHARVVRPDGAGGRVAASWATRCLDPSGAPLTTQGSSGNEIVLDGGTGRLDPDTGSVAIAWDASFTVVLYGGLTYWSASDPVLTIGAGGSGSLTAVVSGYATSREGGRWAPVAGRRVELATFSGAALGPTGVVARPDYLGRAVTVPEGGTPQVARTESNSAYWGAFPQAFVDVQQSTGQGSYWYSSGGARDVHKVAQPLTVSWSARTPLEGPAPGGTAAPSGSPSAPVAPAPRPARATSPPAASVPVAEVPLTGAGGLATPAPSTVLAGTGLIPAGTAATAGVPVAIAGWGLAGVLGLAAVQAAGLAGGWLQLPGRRRGAP